MKSSSRPGRRSYHRIALVAISVGAVIAVTTPAIASTFYGATGKTGCTAFNMADNHEHTYYYSNLTAAMTAATTWSRINNVNPTDMTTVLMSSESSATDVVVYDTNYTSYCGYTWHTPGEGGVIGLATCVSVNRVGECEKHEMRFDTSYTADASLTNRRSLACHETGHTLGIGHSTECLATPLSGSTIFSSHDIAHINANY